MSIEGLPILGEVEGYSCFFQDTETSARLMNTGVICSTPDASDLPSIGDGDGEYRYVLSVQIGYTIRKIAAKRTATLDSSRRL